MKKLFFLLPLLTLLFAVSCSKDDDGSKKHQVVVATVLPDEVKWDDVTSLSVTATSKATSEQSVVTVDKNGEAVFNLTPGIYDFVANGSTEKYHINGLLNGVEVYAAKELEIKLIAGVSSTLVLKEVYFSGVLSSYFIDAFYEIYNNTDEVQYLDGVILATIERGWAVNTSNPQPSMWMENGEYKGKRYPLTSHVQCFPGTGKSYPIEPRTSVIVAANPIDHTARDLKGDDEKSPVNLTNAQWQLYTDNTFPVDSKVAGVPSMVFGWKTWGREMMPATDGQAIILARISPSDADFLNYVADPENIEKHPSTSSTFLMIPTSSIIDAIDIVPFTASERFKIIEAKDDAGMAWVSGKDGNSNCAYSGKSLRRKVVGFTADQKPIYKDTNNSTNDFILGGGAPTPGVHPTTIDN